MNVSKISRSIIVAIFVILVCFLSCFDLINIYRNLGQSTMILNIIKVLYPIGVIVLVSIYMYLKEKFNKLKIKRLISILYRYIYLIFIGIGLRICTLYKIKNQVGTNFFVGYILGFVISAIIIKKIIFNISKSDLLSVFGYVMFCMIPIVVHDKQIMIYSLVLTMIFLVMIYGIVILIDELKQIRIKNKKYIKISIFIGILLAFTVLFGISRYVWIVIAIMSVFVTENLDFTHFTFPSFITNNISQNCKEKLYKIERININKLLYSLLTITLVAVGCFYIVRWLLVNIDISNIIVDNLKNMYNLVAYNKISFSEYLIQFKYYFIGFSSNSKVYYLIIYMYILFMEILSIYLKRKYDTKTTILKLIFISIFVCNVMFSMNYILYQILFNGLLIMIAIVNTSNIYLNREERIKLLVA